MKKSMALALALAVSAAAGPGMLSAQEKLAQTGFEFLSVGPAGRASGLADAVTTASGYSGALFYNPAGLAGMTGLVDVTASLNDWIADIRHYAFSVSVAPANEKYGVIGIGVMYVNYGEFQGTMVWNNDQGYIDTEVFTPHAMAVGIGYAKSLSDRFAVGGQIKYVSQSSGRNIIPDETSETGLGISKNVLSTWAIDFGTLYRTGFKSLAFGMSVRNLSREVKYDQDGFQLPMMFRMGISMDLLDLLPRFSNIHSLLLAVDAVHPRSHSEYIGIGLEYTFLKLLSVRVGYLSNQDEVGLTYGFGIQRFGLAFDYAYTPFGVFDNVQKMTVRFSL